MHSNDRKKHHRNSNADGKSTATTQDTIVIVGTIRMQNENDKWSKMTIERKKNTLWQMDLIHSANEVESA